MTAESGVRPSPPASAPTRVAGLGSAVRTLAGSRGWRTAGLGVAAATGKVTAICPGVAS